MACKPTDQELAEDLREYLGSAGANAAELEVGLLTEYVSVMEVRSPGVPASGGKRSGFRDRRFQR